MIKNLDDDLFDNGNKKTIKNLKEVNKMPNKLKGYRVMAGYTQEEIASALGISAPAYNNKEKGITKISVKEAKIIMEMIRTRIKDVNFNDIFLD